MDEMMVISLYNELIESGVYSESQEGFNEFLNSLLLNNTITLEQFNQLSEEE